MYIYNLVDNLKNELYLTDIGDFNKSILDGEILLEIPITYSINKNYMNMLKQTIHMRYQKNSMMIWYLSQLKKKKKFWIMH